MPSVNTHLKLALADLKALSASSSTPMDSRGIDNARLLARATQNTQAALDHIERIASELNAATSLLHDGVSATPRGTTDKPSSDLDDLLDQIDRWSKGLREIDRWAKALRGRGMI